VEPQTPRHVDEEKEPLNMNVKVLRLGHSAKQLNDLPAGATVGDLLDRADIPPSQRKGFSVMLDGLTVGMDTSLHEGAIVTVVPHIEGGARP
jgi:sulfur carrier protein ThiS